MGEKREKQNWQKRILFLHEKNLWIWDKFTSASREILTKKNSRLLVKLCILGKQCPTPGGAKLIRVAANFSTFFALTVKFGPNLDNKKQKKIYAGPKKFRVTALVRFQIFWEF